MSRKRKEIDEVTQKVQNTKKEIDQLKAELEKLINSGINSTKRFPFTSVDKENVAQNVHESQQKPEARITFRNVSDVVKAQPNLKSSHVSRKDIPRLQPPSTNGTSTRNTSKSPECNKKCSYNRDEAREYIKKQKEKRKETAKLSGRSAIDAEEKKKKLKELHQKSLQLVKKNVEQKRKRSKSRESNQQTEKLAQGTTRDWCQVVSHIPDLIMPNIVVNKTNKQMNAQKTNGNLEINDKPSRKADKIEEPSISVQTKPLANTKIEISDLQNKAAIKIQSHFRGYLQRKRYNKIKEAKKQLLANVAKTTAETQTERKKDSLPDWLNPSTISHPYNFISTVKRKLNFAVKSSPDIKLKTPENSFVINAAEVKTPSQQLFQKTKDDLKEVIQKSAKANKNNNGNLWDMIAQIRATNVMKSPEMMSLKPPQGSTHSKRTVNSDSDTSKNIPDINSEASTHSSRNKISNKDTSLDTDYPTDSDFSEAKLNTDRLKHLQLQRKKLATEKEKQKSKNSSSGSSIKTVKTPSEAKTNGHKLSKSSINSFETFPGKSTITEDDILAFNVSPVRANTEKDAQEELQPPSNINLQLPKSSSRENTLKSKSTTSQDTKKHAQEELQPPSNLNLRLPKSSSTENSLKSKSTTSQESSIKTDTNYSYTSAFSVVSSKNLLTVPSLPHPDVTIYPVEETDKASSEQPVKTTSVISLKEDGDKATINTKASKIITERYLQLCTIFLG